MDNDFGHWLAGFVDGEGCFALASRPRWGVQAYFRLSVRADDVEILRQIQKATGLGSVTISAKQSVWHPNPIADWNVTNQKDCRALVALFDQFPLRAKKRRDFAIWREAVFLWTTRRRNESWETIAALAAQLKAIRAFEGVEMDIVEQSPQLELVLP